MEAVAIRSALVEMTLSQEGSSVIQCLAKASQLEQSHLFQVTFLQVYIRVAVQPAVLAAVVEL